MANSKRLSLLTGVGLWTIGGLLGGLVGSLAAVLLTESIKQILAATSTLGTVWLLLLPLLGVTLAVFVLHGLGKGEAVQTLGDFRQRSYQSARISLELGTNDCNTLVIRVQP